MSRLVIPKLAFLLHVPDIYFHYQPVLDRLHPENFDIILPDDPPEELLEIVALRQYRFAYISDLLAARTLYKYLVTDHLFLNDYQLLQNLGQRQIRFFSELGYDRLNLGNNNRFYDLALCMGRYQVKRLSFCSNTRFFTIGWPRMDAWYEGLNIDLNTLLESLNCDRYRPVLVWLPTFGDLSSIEAYADMIGALVDRYNIIVKPHPYTLLEEPERLQILKDLRVQKLITEPYDELLLHVAGDYILSDYGGAPFGAVFTDQRLILMDIPDAFSHEFTGLNSSDVVLRNYYPSLDSGDNPDVLIGLIEGEDIWKNTARHNRMRDRLFSPNYGRAAQETASLLSAVEQFL